MNALEWINGRKVIRCIVPAEVAKLGMIRACRATPWGEATLWDAVKAALAASDEITQEDWNAAQVIPRDAPDFLAVATTLATEAGMTEAETATFIDGLFVIAGQE